MTTDTTIHYENVSGIFPIENMYELIDELVMRNIPQEDINVLMSESTGDTVVKMHSGSKLPEGATVGGISGGVLGGIIGGLTLIGSVLAPGVGLLVAGPIAGILAGTSIGMGAGGLLGALVGAGIPEHEAKYYQNALTENETILLMAHVPKDLTPEVKALFKRYEVKDLKVTH